MARTQAKDYLDKRMHILDVATGLFADKGFHATSISDIAEACDTSKSRLYHYFVSKEQLLFEILHSHACGLRDIFAPMSERGNMDAAQILETFAAQLIFKNITSRAQHKLILGELDALSEPHRTEIAGLLRQPIESIYGILAEINPQLATHASTKFPVAMMLIGMINWTHTWFSKDGELSPEVFAKLLSQTFIRGFANVDLPTQN